MKVAIRSIFLGALFSCAVVSASDSKSGSESKTGAGDATPSLVKPAESQGLCLKRVAEFCGGLPSTARNPEKDVKKSESGKEAE